MISLKYGVIETKQDDCFGKFRHAKPGGFA